MRLSFAKEELETLYVEGKSNHDLSDSVIGAFFYHLAAVVAAETADDLTRLRSLPLYASNGRQLIRLGESWKLVITFDNREPRAFILDLVQNVLETA